MSKEIEIKLGLQPQYSASFLQLDLMKHLLKKAPIEKLLHSVYLDTPQLLLRQNQWGFRLRKTPQGWKQTLKTKGDGSGALHRRFELETELGAAKADFSVFANTPFAAFFERHGPDLKPVFETVFTRHQFDLEMADGTRVELVLDRGEVRAGSHALPLCEVELELKAGKLATMLKFAVQLAAALPFFPETISKAQRGYALLQKVDRQPKPWPPQSAEPSPLEAFTVWQYNQPLVCQRHLEACLHLTAAVAYLADFCTRSEACPKALEEDFRWLKTVLTQVHQNSTQDGLAENPLQPGRYAALVMRLLLWLETQIATEQA